MGWIDRIPEEFLLCRDISHAWEGYDAFTKRVSRGGSSSEIHQVLRCTRCATLKTRYLTMQGEVIRRPSYSYPKGYLLAEQGRMSPADRNMIRLINYKRNKKNRSGDK